MIAALRELQAPLLGVILLGACAAKLSHMLRARSVTAVLDAASLFPDRLRRPAIAGLCATETALGLALLATAGAAGKGGAADAARLAAAVFFLVGMCALVELRARRPEAGCGCFGGLSARPAGVRPVIRAGFLAGMALAGLHLRPFRLPPPGAGAVTDLGLLAAELLVLALVSPELGEVLIRLGYSEPCEVRPQSPKRPLAALRRSGSWRRHAGMITGGPADMWRELCWWYVVYPARSRDRDCEVVFAVEVARRRPAIRAAVVGAAPCPPGAGARPGARFPPRPGARFPPRPGARRDASAVPCPLGWFLSRSRAGGIQRDIPPERRRQAGCARRNRPKCGTVKAIRPRSEL